MSDTSFKRWSNQRKKEREEKAGIQASSETKLSTAGFSEWSNERYANGQKGWQQYLDDVDTAKAEQAQKQKSESFWERIGRYLGPTGATDTSISLGETAQLVHDMRDDTSDSRPSDGWSQKQQYTFGELYLKSPEEAYAFAKKTNKENNEKAEQEKTAKIQAEALKNGWAGLGHTLGSVGASFGGMADYLYMMARSNAGKDPTEADGSISPFEYATAVQEAIGSHLNEVSGTIDDDVPVVGGKGLGDLYGIGTSIMQSAASGYLLGPAGTLVSYFGSGAASGMKDALERGATDGQAALYGMALGAFEGITEEIGIDNLFKLGSSSTIKGFLKNLGKQALSEGTEEALNTILSTAADAFIMKDKSEYNLAVAGYIKNGLSEEEAKKKAAYEIWEGVVYDALAGAISGGVHGGIQTGINNIRTNVRTMQTYSGQEQALINEALASKDAYTHEVGQRYQDKLNDNGKLSGMNLRELLEAIDKSKIKSAVTERLTELGETKNKSEVADAITRIIENQALGQNISQIDQARLNNSDFGNLILTEIMEENLKSGNLQNEWAKDIGTRVISPEIYGGRAKNASESVSKIKTINDALNTKGASESKKNALGDVKSDIDAGSKSDTKNIDNGNLLSSQDEAAARIRESGGSARAIKEKIVASMEASTETESIVKDAIAGLSAEQVKEYSAAIPLAYSYGKIGYEAGLGSIDMPENLKRDIYTRGRIDAAIETDKRAAKAAANAKTQNTKVQNAKENGVIFEEGFNYDEKSASDIQKTSMEHIDVISRMTNLEVHVFESVVEDGERVYRVNGETRSAQNGYFTDGNKIYIDFNAGDGGEGAMLYTMAHEISHYVREWNANGFLELADFLIEQYGEQGVDVEQLLEEQIGKLKEQYRAEGKALPSEAKLRDAAYEELVADATSEMLADDAAYEKLAKLKQENKTLWEKIGDAIRAMLDKIKGALGIYEEADSALPSEARAVRELSSDVYDKLQDLYVKAFVEADESYYSQNLGNGEIRYSFRDSKSGMANDALLPYDDELAGYITQRGDYIVDSYEKLEKIVDLAFDNNKIQQTAYFGIIDTPILKKIENSVPNLPKVNNGSLFKVGRDYSVAATLDSIRHMVDEKSLSRSDVVDYLDRLADTILEFDSASFDYYYDKYGEKHDGILFKKKFSDEILVSFDLVSNKKRSLTLQTLYMEGGDYIKKKAAKTLLMQNSLSRTPEVRAGQPSDYRISQNSNSVNSKNQNSEKNFSTESETKNSARRTAMKEIRERLQANQVDTDKIIELADKYYKDTGGYMSQSSMRYKFLAIADQIMSDYDAAFEDIKALAADIVNDPKPPADIADTLKEIRAHVKNAPLCITDHDKGEFGIYGGYNAFRKENMGRLRLTNYGMSPDSLYLELQDVYGKAYFPDVNTVAEMVIQIAKVVNSDPMDHIDQFIYDQYYNEDDDFDFKVSSIAQDLGEIIADSWKRGGLRFTELDMLKESDLRSDGKLSDRELLANALESTAKSDSEKNMLSQYKEKIRRMSEEQKVLDNTRKVIKELSFKKGKRDTARISTLKELASKTENRINTYDRQLLRLESTSVLSEVVKRERQKAYKKASQKSKATLAEVKERNAKTMEQLIKANRESRAKATEKRQNTAVREKIRKKIAELNRLLLNPTKESHVPIGLQDTVARALDAINTDGMNAEERVEYYNELIENTNDEAKIAEYERKRDYFDLRDTNFKERIKELKSAYSDILTSEDPLVRSAYREEILQLIDRTSASVKETSLKDMTRSQLEEVYDMYTAVLHTVRDANKMFTEAKLATISENSQAVMSEIGNGGSKQNKRISAMMAKMIDAVKRYGWSILKPTVAMRMLGSKTMETLFGNVRTAEDTWAVDVSEAKQFFEDTAKRYGYDGWNFDSRSTFEDGSGNSVSLSLGEIMSLYAYSKREDADKHLEIGGFLLEKNTTATERSGKLGIPIKYNVNDSDAHRLGRAELENITAALTNEQRAFVDEMQEYLSGTMGEKGNEVSLNMYGIKLFKDKNYFPIKTSRYYREYNPESGAIANIKNSSFTKKTVPNARNPIVLSDFMSVWSGHVNDMSMYHAFTLPLEDFMRVYNFVSVDGEGYESVKHCIQSTYGDGATGYIQQLMQDINGGARTDPNASIFNRTLTLFKKSAVFGSLSVTVQQPTAIARAFAYIDPKHFFNTSIKALDPTKHREKWEQVKKYAPVAIIKEIGRFDTGMGKSTNDWIAGKDSVMDKVDNLFGRAPAYADEMCWIQIFEAVKDENATKSEYDVDSEAFLTECGKRFTEVITNTQVYDSVMSRSGMMRSNDALVKTATSFMAEPITTLNMLADAIVDFERTKNTSHLLSTIGGISASIILNSIVVAFVYAARDDDEDETYAEKYVESLTSELLDGFNVLTYLPYIRDIWSLAQGYDVERSDISVFANLVQAIEGMFSVNKSGWEKAASVGGSLASIFGLPVSNIIRDVKGMFNLTETLTNGQRTTVKSFWDAAGDAAIETIPFHDQIFGHDSKQDKLYDALMSGDDVLFERISGTYKSESAVEGALKNALRENDPRIREAALARIDGNITEYSKIVREITAEGKLSQDIVVGAVNAEINAIKKENTSSKEQQTDKSEGIQSSIYSPSDMNDAFDNGDITLGKYIIKDIVAAKVASGVEESKAKASLRSSMTSYYKPLYVEAAAAGNKSAMQRIKQILYSSGLYGSAAEVVKTVREWTK